MAEKEHVHGMQRAPPPTPAGGGEVKSEKNGADTASPHRKTPTQPTERPPTLSGA